MVVASGKLLISYFSRYLFIFLDITIVSIAVVVVVVGQQLDGRLRLDLKLGRPMSCLAFLAVNSID